MRITPRKTELAAVVELLESDEFDSANDLAKAIVRTVFSELMERDLWCLASRLVPGGAEPVTVLYGPFTSETEATRFAKAAEITGLNLALPMYSPAIAVRAHDERKAIEDRITAGEYPTCKCGHPDFTHQHNGYGGKCATGGCGCARFADRTEVRAA